MNKLLYYHLSCTQDKNKLYLCYQQDKYSAMDRSSHKTYQSARLFPADDNNLFRREND